MAHFDTCSACDGFVPANANACPHCRAARTPLRRGKGALKKVLGVASGGAVAVTLMACYGGPPPEPPSRAPPPEPATSAMTSATAAAAGPDAGAPAPTGATPHR